MCTLVMLRRPGHRWPVLIGANRDELASRPWRGPGRHWSDRPGISGGLDLERGGTWLAINDSNVLAVLLNRPAADLRASGTRTRGELPLLALDQDTARTAAAVIMQLDPKRWKPFNLVLADRSAAIWIRADGRLTQHRIPAGISLLANGDMNAAAPARIHACRRRFATAAVPDPDHGCWEAWTRLLGEPPSHGRTRSAGMVVPIDHRGFGTLSSTVLAIPARPSMQPAWKFASGPPSRAAFRTIRIGRAAASGCTAR